MLAWVVLWLITLAVIVVSIAAVLPETAAIGSYHLWDYPPLKWLRSFRGWQLTILTGALGLVATSFIVPYFGRVVRYTRAKPDNIAARKNIRERGLALLSELHQKEYERIIVVGHSLGSILAYDLISYFWAEHQAARVVTTGSAEFMTLLDIETALHQIETALREIETSRRRSQDRFLQPAVAAFHAAQTKFGHLLRTRNDADRRWLITDFVTLGSPLTHAEFLMASSKPGSRASVNSEREYPTIAAAYASGSIPSYLSRSPERPAFRFTEPGRKLLAFPFGGNHGSSITPRHMPRCAGPISTTPPFLVAFGDLISGPLAPVFGPAIIDVKSERRFAVANHWSFTHTKYWSLPGSERAMCP